MTQPFNPTAQTAVSQPYTTGVYPAPYGGAPPVQAGCMWAYEFPRREVWVEGTSIVNGAPINNLYAETGSPNTGTVLISSNPLTYVDQSGSNLASGFQISTTTQNNGNVLQVDPGTGYLQTNLTHDFFFSTSNIYPNTGALDTGKYVFSKASPAGDTVGGMFIERAHGQTGGSAVRINIKCSDSATNDYTNTSVSPAGTGQGFHYIAFGKIGASLFAFYDANLIGTATGLTTWSANSFPICQGGRPTGSAANQILGMTMVTNQGVDLTLAAAAMGGGTTTQEVMFQLAGNEWGYLFPLYGAFV